MVQTRTNGSRTDVVGVERERVTGGTSRQRMTGKVGEETRREIAEDERAVSVEPTVTGGVGAAKKRPPRTRKKKSDLAEGEGAAAPIPRVPDNDEALWQLLIAKEMVAEDCSSSKGAGNCLYDAATKGFSLIGERPGMKMPREPCEIRGRVSEHLLKPEVQRYYIDLLYPDDMLPEKSAAKYTRVVQRLSNSDSWTEGDLDLEGLADTYDVIVEVFTPHGIERIVPAVFVNGCRIPEVSEETQTIRLAFLDASHFVAVLKGPVGQVQVARVEDFQEFGGEHIDKGQVDNGKDRQQDFTDEGTNDDNFSGDGGGNTSVEEEGQQQLSDETGSMVGGRELEDSDDEIIESDIARLKSGEGESSDDENIGEQQTGNVQGRKEMAVISSRNCSATPIIAGNPAAKFCSGPAFSQEEKTKITILFELHSLVKSFLSLLIRIPAGTGPGLRGSGKSMASSVWRDYEEPVIAACDKFIVACICATKQVVRSNVDEVLARKSPTERTAGIRTIDDMFLSRVDKVFGTEGSFNQQVVVKSEGVDSWYTAAMLLDIAGPISSIYHFWRSLRVTALSPGTLCNRLEKMGFMALIKIVAREDIYDACNPPPLLFDPLNKDVTDSKVSRMSMFVCSAIRRLFTDPTALWRGRILGTENDVNWRVWSGRSNRSQTRMKVNSSSLLARSSNYHEGTAGKVSFDLPSTADFIVKSRKDWKSINAKPVEVIFVIIPAGGVLQTMAGGPDLDPDGGIDDTGDKRWRPGPLAKLQFPEFLKPQTKVEILESTDPLAQFGRLHHEQSVMMQVAFPLFDNLGQHKGKFAEAAADMFGQLVERNQCSDIYTAEQWRRRLSNAEYATNVLPVLIARMMPGRNADNKMSRSGVIPAVRRRLKHMEEGNLEALIDEYLEDHEKMLNSDKVASETAVTSSKVKRFFNLASTGQLGKARKHVESNGVADPSNVDVSLALQSAYQHLDIDNYLPDDAKDELPDLTDVANVEIDSQEVLDVLDTFKRYKAHAYWSYELLAGLKPTEASSVLAASVIARLTDLCEIYANGGFSPQMTWSLEVGKCVALHKNSTSAKATSPKDLTLRNITPGDPFKQFMETVTFAAPFKGIGERVFNPVQLGVDTKNGASLFPQGVSLHLALNKGHMAISLDVKSAYGSIIRKKVAQAVYDDSSLRPYYKCTYKKLASRTPVMVQHGAKMETLGNARAEEGLLMGAMASGFLFCKTVQPDLEIADEELVRVGGMCRAGADDIVLCGPVREVTEAFVALKNRLRLLGLELNMSKCVSYIDKKFRTVEVARSMVEIGIGVSSLVNGAITKLPMDEYTCKERDLDSSDDVEPGSLVLTARELTQKKKIIGKVLGKQDWGFVVFGVPIGDDEYIVAHMKKKTESMLEEDQALINFQALAQNPMYSMRPWRMTFWALAKHCINRKLEFWLRSVRPDLIEKTGIVDSADRTIISWVARLGDLPDMQRDDFYKNNLIDDEKSFQKDPTAAAIVAMLRMNKVNGGLGLTANRTIAGAACLAGFADVANRSINRWDLNSDGTKVMIRGLFPSIEAVFGEGSFDYDEPDKLKHFFSFATSKKQSHSKLAQLAKELLSTYQGVQRQINPDTTEPMQGCYTLGWEDSKKKFPDDCPIPKVPQSHLQQTITTAVQRTAASHIFSLVQANINSNSGRAIDYNVGCALLDNKTFADQMDYVNAAFDSFPTPSSSLSDAQFQLALAQRLGLATRGTKAIEGKWIGIDDRVAQIDDQLGHIAVAKQGNLGSAWTRPHDAIVEALESIAKDAGLKAGHQDLRNKLFGNVVDSLILSKVSRDADKVGAGHQNRVRQGVTPDTIIEFPPGSRGVDTVIDVKRISPGTQSYYPKDGSYRSIKEGYLPPVEMRARDATKKYKQNLENIDSVYCGTMKGVVGPFQGAMYAKGGTGMFVVGRCGEINVHGRSVVNDIVNHAAYEMFRNGRVKSLNAGKSCQRRYYSRAMGIAILKAQADSILQALSLCAPTKGEAAERWAMMASTGQRFSRARACQAVDDTFRYFMFSRPTGERSSHGSW